MQKRFFETTVCSFMIAALVSAQPRKVEADWGKVAAVVAGVAAVGYVAYRGYEHYEASHGSYNGGGYSGGSYGGRGYSGGGGDDYYSTSNDEADAEANRIYNQYLKKWNAHRDADVAQMQTLRENAISAMEAQAAASKEAWVCSAICASDDEDRASELSDDRDGRLKMFHLTGTVVSDEGKNPVDILNQMTQSCEQRGKSFLLANDVVTSRKSGVSNIGFVTAYGGNSCMLTGAMTVEQASQGANLDLSKDNDYRTKIVDLKLDRADESASPAFMRELATYISVMETDSVMDELKDIKDLKELMKKFTIKQDRAAGTITLFDSHEPADTRDVYIIHPELNPKTNQVTMHENVDFIFETAHACGTESHRVTVTLFAVPAAVKVIQDQPTAAWVNAKKLASKAPSASDDYCPMAAQ